MPDSEELTLALDKYRVRLKTLLLKKAEESETKLRLISERASRESFLRRIENLMVTTDRTFDLLLKSFEGKVERKTALLSQSAAKLDALSPLKVFDRGYSVAYHKDKVLKSVKEIENNDTIHLVLKDGRVEAQVGRIEEAL